MVKDKSGAVARLQYNAAQHNLVENSTGRDIVLKARQLGISTVIQAEFFRACITRPTATITLCHESELTTEFRERVDRFFDNMTDPPKREYANATVTTYPFYDSRAFIATVGGQAGSTKGRGQTCTHFHGSEVAFWRDAGSVIAGALQAGNPEQVYLESTPNGAQGWFYERCMEALDGNNEWTLHFYPWWWDEGYRLPLDAGERLEYTDEEARLVEAHNLTPEQIKWRRAKIHELRGVGGTANLFPQEYPEDAKACFLLSGAGYFGSLAGVFVAERVEYNPERKYFGGLDFGQTEDYTVLSIIDGHTNAQVDLLRVNRLPWADMRRLVVEYARKWNLQALLAEKNSMGSTNIEALHTELKSVGLETSLMAFTTTNETKAQAASMLHSALYDAEIPLRLLPLPDQQREMRAFQAKQSILGTWQLAAPAGEHDDIVIANMLANYCKALGNVRWQNIGEAWRERKG